MVSNNSSNNFGVSSYVVSSIPQQASFTTIQAAINAAAAAGIFPVYIQPGTYNENLLMPASTILVGSTGTSSANQVVIVGSHTTNANGVGSFSNITFQTTANVFNTPGIGGYDIHCEGCTFDITVGGVVCSMGTSNGNMEFFNCFDQSTGTSGICSGSGNISLFMESSSIGIGGTTNIAGSKNSFIRNSFTTANISLSGTMNLDTYYTKYGLGTFVSVTTGLLRISQCEIVGDVSITGAGCVAILTYNKITGTLTTGSTANVFLNYCDLEDQLIHNSSSQMRVNNCIVNTTNPAITGTGGVLLGAITFPLGVTIDNPIFPVGRTTTGNLLAYGNVSSAGDSGPPLVSEIAITNQVNTVQGAGSLTIRSTTANSGTNTGFIKYYVGGNAVFVPYFANVAP